MAAINIDGNDDLIERLLDPGLRGGERKTVEEFRRYPNKRPVDNYAKLKDCTICDDDDSKLKRDNESDVMEPTSSGASPKKNEGAACEKKREIIGVYCPSFPLEILFKQPEGSHLGDCPICMIPLSLETKQWSVYSCCGKMICNGCNFSNQRREREMRLGDPRCAFCRTLVRRSKDEAKRNEKKKLAANDPATLKNVGAKCLNSMKMLL